MTPISFTFAAPVGNRTLGLNDTRILVNSLATSALHLADLGLGGIIYNDPYEAYALFILPGGNQALLENGEPYIPSCWRYLIDGVLKLLHRSLSRSKMYSKTLDTLPSPFVQYL